MKFTPKTDEEIKAMNILDAGKYPFEISGAVEKVSKSSGMPMIELTVRVYDADNKIHLVTDYLPSSERAAFKRRNICKAIGLVNEYDSGSLEADMFIGKTGYLELIVEKSVDYGDKNKIKEYVVSDEKFETNKKADAGKVAEILDDEIPF